MQEIEVKYPLVFHPVFKQTLWGGDRIVSFMSLPYSSLERIGECWAVSGIKDFVSVVKGGKFNGKSLPEVVQMCGPALMGAKNAARFGKEFPLLVKFIDAAQDLSVQVHPDDAMAQERHGCSGKTEMWYVVGTKDNAKLFSGFAKPVTREQYDNMSAKEILDSLQKYDISEGDMFHLPAGTVHSIGAGAFIVEVQQASDITYRIYDYDRKDKDGKYRELHTQLAADAIDFASNTNCRKNLRSDVDTSSGDAWDYVSQSVECGHFVAALLSLQNDSKDVRRLEFSYSHLDSFVILTCTSGACSILYTNSGTENRLAVNRGDSVLLPADLKNVIFELQAGVTCEVLETHI